MPTSLDTIMGDTISAEGFEHCTTDMLHGMLAHVTQRFMRIGHADKSSELLW